MDFQRTPIAGVHSDNIYTRATDANDQVTSVIGQVPGAEQTLGPLTQTDSFLVP